MNKITKMLAIALGLSVLFVASITSAVMAGGPSSTAGTCTNTTCTGTCTSTDPTCTAVCTDPTCTGICTNVDGTCDASQLRLRSEITLQPGKGTTFQYRAGQAK